MAWGMHSKGLKGGKWSRERGGASTFSSFHLFFRERTSMYFWILYSTAIYKSLSIPSSYLAAHGAYLGPRQSRVVCCCEMRVNGWVFSSVLLFFPTFIFMSTPKNDDDDDIPKTKRTTTRNQQVATSFHPKLFVYFKRGAIECVIERSGLLLAEDGHSSFVQCSAAAHVFIIQCRCILLCRLENFIRTTKKKPTPQLNDR